MHPMLNIAFQASRKASKHMLRSFDQLSESPFPRKLTTILSPM